MVDIVEPGSGIVVAVVAVAVVGAEVEAEMEVVDSSHIDRKKNRNCWRYRNCKAS